MTFSFDDKASLRQFIEARLNALPPLEVPDAALTLATKSSPFQNLTASQQTHFISQTFGANELLKRIQSGDEYRKERATLIALHVETLLDQAADLLERVLKARERISNLKLSLFNNILDLWEFEKLDAIHAKEIDAGRYAIAKKEKEGEIASMESQVTGLNEQEKLNSGFLQAFAPNGDYVVRSRDAALLTAATSSARSDVQEPDEITVRFNKINGIAGRVHGVEAHQVWTSYKIQEESLSGGKKSLEHRISGQKPTRSYLQAAEGLQIDRVKVARQLYFRKLAESSAPGGALHYEEQIQPIAAVAERDLAHALARLSVADAGMKMVYGYSPEFPGTADRALDIDNCVIWARDAISFLRTFVLQDLTLTVPVSLKAAVGRERFERTLRQSGGKAATWKFSLPEPGPNDLEGDGWRAILQDKRHVRMRGVSAFVEDNGARPDSWQVSVRAPKEKCLTRYIDGKQGDLTAEQSRLPTIWLGRASRGDSPRAPEIGGTTMLLNATPFGEWELSINGRSLSGVPLAQGNTINISDIRLELVVACRAA